MVQYDLCKNLTGHTQQGIATVVIRGVGRCLGLGGGKHCSFRMLNDIHEMKLIIACMQNNIDVISIYCLHAIS